MSLIVDTNLIKITKPNGAIQFNSNDKLIHRKFSSTGSTSVGASFARTSSVTFNVNFNTDKDLALVFITPTAGNGNVASQYLNSTIQLNFAMLMHFTHETTIARISAYDQISAGITIGTDQKPTLTFSTVGFEWTQPGVVCIEAPATSLSFSWKFVLLTYQ